MNKFLMYICFSLSGVLVCATKLQGAPGDDERVLEQDNEEEAFAEDERVETPGISRDDDATLPWASSSAEVVDRPIGSSTGVIPDADERTRTPRVDATPSQASSSAGTSSSQHQYVEKLIFIEEPLINVLAVLEQLTGKTILRDQKLPSVKISIRIDKPITQEETILAITSALELNGISIIEMGNNFFKAVTAKQAHTQAPKLIDASLLGASPSQVVCSKFFELKFLNVSAFQKLITPILTPSTSSMIVFESSNSFLVTDVESNVQRLEDVLRRVDRPLEVREEIFFYSVRNAQASVLKDRLVAMQNGVLKKYLQGVVSFEADDRSSQLAIVVHPENLAFVRGVVEKLDVDRDPLIRTEVFRIRHGAAKDLAEVIKKVVESQRRQEERANTYRLAQQRLSQTSRTLLPNSGKDAAPEAAETGESSGEGGTQAIQFSKALSLEADERSNSILAYGTQTDIAQIRSIISKLDIVLDQVRIEVVVAQVRLTKGQVSGLESFGLGRDTDNGVGRDGIRMTAGSHNIRILPKTASNNDAGLSQVTLLGDASSHRFALSAVFQKAREDQNVKIMSAPTIVTTHNREAVIEVGESRPIITASSVDGSNVNQRRSEVTYKNIGLKLKVKPFIGSNGVIQMEIEQTVEKKQGDVQIDNNTQPIITKRQANSFVSVANQDVVVMAGLQEKTQDFKKGKLWLFGDLPFVGDALFSSRNRNEETVELIIFIKPTIIAQPQDEQDYLEKRARVADVYDDLRDYEEKGSFPSGSPFPKTTFEPVNSFDESPIFEHSQPRHSKLAADSTIGQVDSKIERISSARRAAVPEKNERLWADRRGADEKQSPLRERRSWRRRASVQ